MTRIIFPNVRDSQTAFTIHNNTYDIDDSRRSGSAKLAEWAGQFQTYADEMTQHSPEWQVLSEPAEWANYCESLAIFVLSDSPEAREAGDMLRYHLYHSSYAEPAAVTFAMSVKHKEGKRQYYSMSDRKVSTSESKRHDRRWEEVPEWADGSLASVWRLLKPGYDMGALPLYIRAAAIRDEYNVQTGNYTLAVNSMIGLEWERPIALYLRQVTDAIVAIAKAYGQLDSARSTMSCYQSNRQGHETNMARKAEETAEPATV